MRTATPCASRCRHEAPRPDLECARLRLNQARPLEGAEVIAHRHDGRRAVPRAEGDDHAVVRGEVTVADRGHRRLAVQARTAQAQLSFS